MLAKGESLGRRAANGFAGLRVRGSRVNRLAGFLAKSARGKDLPMTLMRYSTTGRADKPSCLSVGESRSRRQAACGYLRSITTDEPGTMPSFSVLFCLVAC